MLINLRNALMAGKRTPLAKDYIQDAIRYFWDGVENYAFGVRDESVNFWQDLIAGERFTPVEVIEPSSIAGTTPRVRWAQNGWLSILDTCGGGECDNANLIGTSAFTIEAVFTNNSTTSYATFLRTRVGDSTNGFQINIPPGTGYANPIFFKPGDIQNNVAAFHSIVFTSTGSNITIYGDGQYRKTASITSSQISSYLMNRKPIKIGAYNPERLTVARGQFNGTIHGIRSHGRALSATEVAYNYALDTERFNLA